MIQLTAEEWKALPALEKNRIVTELAQSVYQEHRQFTPKHPWVLVYVLPKAHKVGTLYLPEKQHKVSLEGIVLSTWPVHNEEKGIIENGIAKTRVIVHRSIFAVGDHVVFPHWSGLPVPGLDENYFRIVKEEGWAKNEEGGIFAKIEYDDHETTSGAVLRDLLSEHLQEGNVCEKETAFMLAAQLESRFILIDKETSSVTLSALHGKA